MTRPTQRRHAGLPAVLRRNQPEQHAGQRPGQGPDATGGAGWSGLHAFKSTAVPLMPPSAGPRPGPCWSNSWFDQFGGLYLNAGSGRGRPCCRLGLVIGVGRMAAFDPKRTVGIRSTPLLAHRFFAFLSWKGMQSRLQSPPAGSFRRLRVTTQNILATLEAEHHEIRGRIAQGNGATEPHALQTHAGATKRELGA